MLVSWKWLNELVEMRKTPEELAELLTMSGIEVEGIEYPEIELKNLKVGLIEEIKPHPDADKLAICRLNIGGGEKVTIVTGARNVCEGQMVPVALPGAVLAGGKKIESAVLRGIQSDGMLCSAEELGIDVDKIPAAQKDGIYILPDNVSIGADVVQLLDLDDVVLELGLTPNRADCLGMWNVAREVAALTGGKLRLPDVETSKDGGACANMTRIEIKNGDLCDRYVGRIIKDVEIAPSPLWMQQRLMAAGIRPINNVVDVTNYVMMETGQPLHSFDYDRLEENRIVVRRAEEGEKIVSLDGQLRTLTPEMLVIADAEKPVAIAGVMGGLETEVTEQTKTILLESASFNGPSIRRTSHALGLRSEASLRFEKSVDIQQVRLVADRAVQLLCQLGAGIAVEGCVDCHPDRAQQSVQAGKTITLRIKRVNQVLGTKIKPIDMEVILKSLQITFIEKNREGWEVLPPSYRRDLEREVDLIEEIARIYSYEQIPTTLPEGATTQGARTPEQKMRYRVRKKLVAQGLMEVVNYSFISRNQIESLGFPEGHPYGDLVIVKNPLSEEQGVMRTTLLPGLLQTVKKNINKRNKNLKFFELGKVFFAGGFPEQRDLPLEEWSLGAVVTGKREKSWAYGPEEYDFYYLKGVVENLLLGLGYSAEEILFTVAHDWPGLHPGRTALIQVKGQEVGVLGEVHPLVLEKFGIEQRVTAFSLEVEKLWAEQEVSPKVLVVPVTKFPAVSRDLAILVPEDITAAAVAELIREQGNEWLKEVQLFDLYRGHQIRENCKSLAFSLTWQAPDKTLTDEEVNTFHQKIETALAERFGADLRR
jgi:phenylalanyl-tRNA synthetase beta chain